MYVYNQINYSQGSYYKSVEREMHRDLRSRDFLNLSQYRTVDRDRKKYNIDEKNQIYSSLSNDEDDNIKQKVFIDIRPQVLASQPDEEQSEVSNL